MVSFEITYMLCKILSRITSYSLLLLQWGKIKYLILLKFRYVELHFNQWDEKIENVGGLTMLS